MTKTSAILILFIFTFLGAQSQTYTISGYVTDDITSEPIEGVNITIFGTKMGVATNEKGYFSIKIKKLPATFKFSHVRYINEDLTLKDKRDQILNIKLTQDIHVGPMAEISPVIDIIKEKPLYVWDYEFYGDSIMLLACKYRKLNQPLLVLMDQQGDTISTREVKKAERLYKDCLDNIHFITRNKAYQLFYDSVDIRLLYPMELADFDSLIPKCLEELNNKFYLSEYYYRNQVLLYYSISREDTSAQQIRVIGDDAALERLAFNDRFWAMGPSPTEHDLRFEEMAFFDPIYAPLVKLGDSLIIFNYVDGQIEFLTDDGKAINEIPIEFHKQKNWKEEIYIDEITKKVYSLFKRDGITTLREISLKDGSLGSEIEIPKFIHIEKIQVRDDTIYFLYIEKEGIEYQKLYKMYIK